MVNGGSVKSWGRHAVLAVVVAAYIVSFFLPVTDGGTTRAMYGFQAFFWGLVSIVYVPMWLANPVAVVWLFSL